MRAICAADIHGDIEAVRRLRDSIRGKDIDYVFLLGDYSAGFKNEAENEADITATLNALSGFTVRAIPGNCDQRSSVRMFHERSSNIHNTVLNLRQASIIGFGGSNPTPFNTPFEYSEADIAAALERLYKLVEEGPPVIVLSHFPPYNTKCDVAGAGMHVGSTALRAFIESKKPDLVLCSHIHESGGAEDTIGKTKILNLGRISEGKAYLLTAETDVKVELYTG